MGGSFIALGLGAAATVFSSDWRPDFNQENLVELLYENAMPGLGLFLSLAMICLGIVFLAKDVLEANPGRKVLTHRMVPPLQPARHYKFSDFHTVSAERHSSDEGGPDGSQLVGHDSLVGLPRMDSPGHGSHRLVRLAGERPQAFGSKQKSRLPGPLWFRNLQCQSLKTAFSGYEGRR
jgi:hypothetical protein